MTCEANISLNLDVYQDSIPSTLAGQRCCRCWLLCTYWLQSLCFNIECSSLWHMCSTEQSFCVRIGCSSFCVRIECCSLCFNIECSGLWHRCTTEQSYLHIECRTLWLKVPRQFNHCNHIATVCGTGAPWSTSQASALGSQVFVGTLRINPSLLALPIIVKQNGQPVGPQPGLARPGPNVSLPTHCIILYHFFTGLNKQGQEIQCLLAFTHAHVCHTPMYGCTLFRAPGAWSAGMRVLRG